MNVPKTVLTILAIALITALPSNAQDKRGYQQALDELTKALQNKDETVRAAAVKKFGLATYDKVETKTAEVIVLALQKEVERAGRDGKYEPTVSGYVLNEAVDVIRNLSDPGAIRRLLNVSAQPQMHRRVRFYTLYGLATSDYKTVHKKLVKLSGDKDPLVQIAALDALTIEGKAESAEEFVEVMADRRRTWEAKISSLAGLEKVAKPKDEKVIEPLIKCLGKLRDDHGRVKIRLMGLLNKLMGTDLWTDDTNAWMAAWTAIQGGKDFKKQQTHAVEMAKFFGMKTGSTRIVFMLDRTGSMNGELTLTDDEDEEKKPKEPPPGDAIATGPTGKKLGPKALAAKQTAKKIWEKYDKREVKTRMDALKKEFINTIYNLDPRVNFTVVWYESNTHPWRDHLVPATWQNKLEVIRYTDSLAASGGTNIFGALEYGLRIIGNPYKPGGAIVKHISNQNYATGLDGADTFFVMTDGAHNSGRYVQRGTQDTPDTCKRDDFMTELKKVNQARKIIIHTICIGSKPFPVPGTSYSEVPDTALMKTIAEATGGSFRHIREKEEEPEPEEEEKKEGEEKEEEKKPPPQEKAALVPVKSKLLEGDTGGRLTGILEKGVTDTGRFILKKRTDVMFAVMSHEAGEKDLYTDTATALKIGEYLKVAKIFAFRLEVAGEKFALFMKVLDVKTGKEDLMLREEAASLSLEDLTKAAEELVKKLKESLGD
ncbi:MAG: hypothetical protein ACYTAF_07505 [Planctomycetota bacterium]|jgi:hypothetical protein